ncbi:MAG: DUF2586 family protein [Bacteroidales bacterium]|nr:DUF2586 family protein [Bacteroidales bacterium]
MGNLKGVDIQRGAIGPAVNGNKDSVCGLLANGPAVAAGSGAVGIALGETVKLTSVADAEALGINEAYDTTNKVRVYRHISEFFRICKEGTLYLMLYSGTPSDAFGNTYGKRMIADSNGEIRVVAIAYNPDENYEPTNVNGIDDNVYAAISAGQVFYDWTYETFRPCQIVLEGRGYAAVTSASALDLRNITIGGSVLEAFKVSVCIGQDWDYAETQNAVGKKFADVGTMLGSIALRPVNHNIGEVEGGDISSAKRGIWVTAGLSNHNKITAEESALETLDTKGYIFAISYTGRSGHYWNNDHTCTPIIQDKEGYFNEYTISYGRTHDKVVRELRTALLPQVKSTQPVDPETGKLPQAMVGYFDALGDDVFARMASSGEITQGKTTTDPNSNLLVMPRELKVSFVIVPTGQIDVIKGTINLKTSI